MFPASDDLINRGTCVLRDSPCPEDATIVAMGAPRSGTTMVAAVLRCLELPLGSRLGRVLEDQDLGPAIDAEDEEVIVSLVSKYNTVFRKWALKRPQAFAHLPLIERRFRNPRLIAVFRDPMAIAMRRQVSRAEDLSVALVDASERLSSLCLAVKRTSLPALVASYEKALQFPDVFVCRVASFCGVSLTEDRRRAALAAIENGNMDYLLSSQLKFDGAVELISPSLIEGWATVVDKPHEKPPLRLAVGGRSVTAVISLNYDPETRTQRFRIAPAHPVDPSESLVMIGDAALPFATRDR